MFYQLLESLSKFNYFPLKYRHWILKLHISLNRGILAILWAYTKRFRLITSLASTQCYFPLRTLGQSFSILPGIGGSHIKFSEKDLLFVIFKYLNLRDHLLSASSSLHCILAPLLGDGAPFWMVGQPLHGRSKDSTEWSLVYLLHTIFFLELRGFNKF